MRVIERETKQIFWAKYILFHLRWFEECVINMKRSDFRGESEGRNRNEELDKFKRFQLTRYRNGNSLSFLMYFVRCHCCFIHLLFWMVHFLLSMFFVTNSLNTRNFLIWFRVFVEFTMRNKSVKFTHTQIHINII